MTTATPELNTTDANTRPASRAALAAHRRAHLRRALAQTLELGGVLTLLGAYVVYIAHALAHLV